MKTRLILAIAASLLMVTGQLLGQEKPDFSGEWKRAKNVGSDILKIDQKEPKIHLILTVVDPTTRNRTLDMKATTDGKEHKFEAEGLPGTVKMKWEGNTLVLEVKRRLPDGSSVHNYRILKLSKDGKTMETDRIDYDPDGKQRARYSEAWTKQEKLDSPSK
jgi:hypothetical protein